jgi:O-methyltransferase
MTAAARMLAAHTALASVPFEYAAGLNAERAQFAASDEYGDTTFVSPVLLDSPTPYALYAESLQRFEQKCGLRDYLDLYQLLRSVVRSAVPGDIAEFGSYRGHSGWLIARTLQALNSDKRLYLFDMFAEFPAETAGVDHFWNRSHPVDFAEVQRKLAPFPNVTLVRGDFTQTLAASGVGRLALAYVDCDSYRATRFLYDALWQKHLAPGALLVCEDYGHPALLGSRTAVHDATAGWKAFQFFSQFSGLHITQKPS